MIIINIFVLKQDNNLLMQKATLNMFKKIKKTYVMVSVTY